MAGEATPAQLGALLAALHIRGETVDEIAGCASALREVAVRVTVPVDAIDIVGTGGDRSNSFNISTVSAIVTAAAGGRVADRKSTRLNSSHVSISYAVFCLKKKKKKMKKGNGKKKIKKKKE